MEDLREPASSSGSSPGRSKMLPPQSDRRSQEALEHANSLAAYSPQVALSSPGIAKLFAHYVDVLAPWYDLNEASWVFGIIVTLTRSILSSPVQGPNRICCHSQA